MTETKQTHSITLASVVSSQILAIGYAAETRQLFVEFKTKTPTRSIYAYENVDPILAEEILFGESVGAAFARSIRLNSERYPYSRVTVQQMIDFGYSVCARPDWFEALHESYVQRQSEAN